MQDASASDTATDTITSTPEGSPIPPSLRLAAVASMAGIRDSRGEIPVYASVPVRAGNFVPTHATAPSARVLVEVDGKLSLREIAARLSLPLETAIEAYFDLLHAGIIRTTDGADVTVQADEDETGVSDVVDAYAQLSAASGTATLRGVVDWADLSAREAWAVSVVGAGLSVRAILDTSPLGEEKTMTLLGELVASRIIAVRP